MHRGWWLVTSIYLVVDAGLSASQLVLIGVAQGAVALVFEVPAGVVADTFSRKWSLVVSHAFMGSAMLATGLVTGFGALLITQMVWGLAWTFASGADVAWITDELAEPARASLVLMRSGRAQLTGAVAGMISIGGLAWLTDRATAMVLSGTAMLLLGLYITFAFHETHFKPPPPSPTPGQPSSASDGSGSGDSWSGFGGGQSAFGRGWAIFVRGSALVVGNRVLVVLFVATFLVNGVTGSFGRLYPLRLVDIGLSVDPVLWLAVLGVLTYLAGALALRPRIRDVRRGYIVACWVGIIGVIGLVATPEEISGSVAILVASSALPLTRTFGTIWINQQTSSDVRATVHSLLAQAEYLGAIACGLVVALVARFGNMSAALLACAALLVIAIVLIQRRAATDT